MKKLIILLCLTLSIVTILASCDKVMGGSEGGEENKSAECTHTFSEKWAVDDTNHWHAATCEHGEVKDSEAAHVDADEDGNCDVCEYKMGHDHTYSSEWESNEESHWRNATCKHTEEKVDLSAHADDNSDGECDVCTAHVHVIDGTGKCAICDTFIKDVDTSNLAEVVVAIVGGHSKVNGGNILSTFTGRYNNSAHSTKTNKFIDYSIGSNSIYYKIASAAEVKSSDKEGVEYEASTTDVMEKWISVEADGSLFGVYKEVGADKPNVDVVTADNFYGYYYSVSTLASGYGAEGVLKALYERSQEKYASGFTVEENNGSYKFSFNYAAINKTNTSDGQGNSLGVVTNVNYFVVSVEFSYNEDFALTNLSITCDCYTNDAGSNLDGDLDIDNVDLEYAAQTGGIVILEGAKADTYTFTVTQTVGEKTFVNEYTKDYFTPSSFEVYSDRDGTIVCPDTITIAMSDYPNDDETYPYVRFRVMPTEEGKIFTDADEIIFTSSDDSGLKLGSFDGVRKMGSFLAKNVGTYTVTVSVNGTVRTFTVIVEA